MTGSMEPGRPGPDTSCGVPVASTRQDAVADAVWSLVLAASAAAGDLERAGRRRIFGLDERSQLRPLSADGLDAVLEWMPDEGWRSHLPAADPRSGLLDLYLPICGATAERPLTVGHLGQSLDGFIATPSGDSEFVTGDHNLVHLHRMRALSDAVVVGAGTVASDNPQLTTRHVPGPHALRVVFDPGRRLGPDFRVFTDRIAPTLYIAERSRVTPGETRMGDADIDVIDPPVDGSGVRQVLALLHARGCARIFVEGGGVTVSAFLEADLLDRLQIAIAPVLIGEGRPAIRLAPHIHLRDCRRPAYRVFRMGGDVLFDCDFRARSATDRQALPPVIRVI